MNEKEKYEYWNKKGIKRGNTYSIEELVLKYKINKICIKYGLLVLTTLIIYLTALIIKV